MFKFNQHESTTNSQRIIYWIYVCLAIVKKAHADDHNNQYLRAFLQDPLVNDMKGFLSDFLQLDDKLLLHYQALFLEDFGKRTLTPNKRARSALQALERDIEEQRIKELEDDAAKRKALAERDNFGNIALQEGRRGQIDHMASSPSTIDGLAENEGEDVQRKRRKSGYQDWMGGDTGYMADTEEGEESAQ
jgi:hypothetical protein